MCVIKYQMHVPPYFLGKHHFCSIGNNITYFLHYTHTRYLLLQIFWKYLLSMERILAFGFTTLQRSKHNIKRFTLTIFFHSTFLIQYKINISFEIYCNSIKVNVEFLKFCPYLKIFSLNNKLKSY